MHSTLENLQVLFEDNHLIIINKRPGDIVQGDKTGDKPLSDVVKEYIKDKYNKPGEVFLGTIHRLDRPTSGIVAFARTSKALERMNEQFRNKEPKKTYWAVVEGKVEKKSQRLVNYLVKNQEKNKSRVCKPEVTGAKEAILTYDVKGAGDNYTYVEVELETGRHHQIRVQLYVNGNIIKGDVKYGARRSNKDGSIHLHSRKLSFVHPIKKEPMTVLAPPPKDALWDDFLKL
jgi:23S rRNA pseudouridine1911/1915/1917 synthase